jgi:hypothetical protein
LSKAKVKKPVRKTLPLPTHTPMTYEEVDVQLNPWSQAAPVAPLGRGKAQVMIVEPDPLAGSAGLIYVLAGQRMLAFAQQFPQEVNPEAFVRMVLARLVARDPAVKVLVAVADGEIVGHILAMLERSGQDCWVFCYQAQVDLAGSDILDQLISAAVPWAKSQGATSVLMATSLDPEFWQRRYGFESVRHVMKRAI